MKTLRRRRLDAREYTTRRTIVVKWGKRLLVVMVNVNVNAMAMAMAMAMASTVVRVKRRTRRPERGGEGGWNGGGRQGDSSEKRIRIVNASDHVLLFAVIDRVFGAT